MKTVDFKTRKEIRTRAQGKAEQLFNKFIQDYKFDPDVLNMVKGLKLKEDTTKIFEEIELLEKNRAEKHD